MNHRESRVNCYADSIIFAVTHVYDANTSRLSSQNDLNCMQFIYCENSARCTVLL